MKIQKKIFLTLSLLFLSTAAIAAESTFGLVNFSKCISESKYGQQEQDAFNQVKTQMTTIITDLEKQLQDIANKFNDTEFLDSLSPEAEQEMKAKFQTMSDEYHRYQNQYMQVLNQANMKLMQTMNQYVSQASEIVAKQKKMPMILREEAFFHYHPSYDVTAAVVKEMDQSFEKASKSGATAQAEPTKK